jgi:hypothetical protein
MDSESPIPELKIRRASREDALAGDPLAEFHVFWFDIIEADLTAYRDVMDAATDERALQRHLTDNPILLSQILDGGHGRWCCRIKTLADGRTRLRGRSSLVRAYVGMGAGRAADAGIAQRPKP